MLRPRQGTARHAVAVLVMRKKDLGTLGWQCVWYHGVAWSGVVGRCSAESGVAQRVPGLRSVVWRTLVYGRLCDPTLYNAGRALP